MLHTLSVLTAEGTDPRRNLALEARLLALPGADPAIVTDILTLLLEEETP